MRAAARVLLLALGGLCCGCFRTTVHSGLPPGRAAPGYDYRWQSNFVFGLIDAHGEYPLDMLCTDGWSEINTQGDFLTGLTSLVTFGIYTPQYVTVVCAVPGGPHAPPESGYDAQRPLLEYPATRHAYPPPPPRPYRPEP